MTKQLSDFEKKIAHARKKISEVETQNDHHKHRILTKDNKSMRKGLRIAGDFMAPIILGVLIGHYGGKYFDFAPWGVLIGLLLGFTTGVYNLIGLSKPKDND